MKTKYSIIIPFYNVENYIIDCVKSIHNQKYQNFEAIFVDDGSKDKSKDKLLTYLTKVKDKRIKILTKKNGGLSDARNFGLKKAKGDYILFVDSDDFVDNKLLEKIDVELTKNNYDILLFDYYSYCSKKEKYLLCGLRKITDDIKKNVLLSPPAAWNKVYKKQLFDNNDIIYPQGIWYEDLATTPRLVFNSNKIGYLSEPLYYYRQREGSIMNTISLKIRDMYEALNIINDYFKSNYYKELEFINIYNVLFLVNCFGRSSLKNKMNYQKEAILYLDTNYPNWFKNSYLKNNILNIKISSVVLKNKLLLFLSNFIRGKNK